jgi:hypothetical protein
MEVGVQEIRPVRVHLKATLAALLIIVLVIIKLVAVVGILAQADV